MLQWLWLEFQVVNRDWLSVAVENGQLSIVEWLLNGGVLATHEMSLKSDSLYHVATRGHWPMLEWVLVHHADVCHDCAFIPRERLRKTLEDGASMTWLPQYTRVVLRLLPTICAHAHTAWLVEWAARHALEDILEQSMATRTASRLIEEIIRDHPEWITRRVVQWAATYGHTSLLETILTLTDAAKHLAFFRTVIFTACRQGHVAVLNWVQQQKHHQVESGIDLWLGAAQAAARHDQPTVIPFLRDERLDHESA